MESKHTIEKKIAFLHEKVGVLLSENREKSEIIQILSEQGIDTAYAELIIDNVKTDHSDKIEFRKELRKGVMFTVLGLVLNMASYFAFASLGAFFWLLYWGIMVFGITLIARAFIIFKK